MTTCLILCDGWSPWSLMGQCGQVLNLFVWSAHWTVRLASTLLGLLCLKSSPRLPFTLWPAEGAVQHIPLLSNSCLCVGSLNRHQDEKLSRLSVHGGTKDKGMNKTHPLLPGEAPGPLWLCFPIFFPLGHAEKNSLGLWDKQVTQSWRLKAAGLEILRCPSPTGLAHYLGHIVLGGFAFQNSHRVLLLQLRGDLL